MCGPGFLIATEPPPITVRTLTSAYHFVVNIQQIALIAVHSTGHEWFYNIVNSQLVLVKFFEAGSLARPHTTD